LNIKFKDYFRVADHLDRKIYIVPSRKLIVVRTGQASPDHSFDQQVWLRLMKAAPK
jgi:hypothetical protein